MSNQLTFNPDTLLNNYEPEFAMAYGSGVFRQASYSESDKPMIDFVFGVDNTRQWHKFNLRFNRKDYSTFAKIMGLNFIEFLQHKGPKMYYHPYCNFNGNTIKYGVISTEALVKDLKEWTHLYVAGRLQKPVQILKSTEDIDEAINTNLQNALITALLLLPENFDLSDLFTTIAGISYTGDSRMKNAENPEKARNIADSNLEGFVNLYQAHLQDIETVAVLNDGRLQQDKSWYVNRELFCRLPFRLTKRAEFNVNQEILSKNIYSALSDIVNGPSKAQTVKGLFTAGVRKSARYVIEKRRKARKKNIVVG